MLDPNWTPEAGYSHADALLRILAERDREADITDEPEPTNLEPT